MDILLVDDEPLARLRLEQLLRELGHTGIRQAADADAARQALIVQRPDLVLLDICMPGQSGLELAAEWRALPNPPVLVFVTAFADFALDAFEVAAQGYLLKPVRQEKLAELLQRLNLSKPTAAPAVSRREYLCAYQGRSWQPIPVSQILFFVADQKYTRVGHLHGEVLIEDSLKDLEQEFEPDFIRIHRNALVALTQIRALERRADGTFELSLQGSSERLEVSRRHLPLVRQKLQR